jgi:hypothetical protein
MQAEVMVSGLLWEGGVRTASQHQQRKRDQRYQCIACGGVLQAQQGQQLATEIERVVVKSNQVPAPPI